MLLTNLSQCSLKKIWKNVNRMAPLSGSQIYKPDEVPSGLQFFYLMTSGRGGVRFTTYKSDDTSHPIHPVNNLWTGRQVVRFSNFKKWEPDGIIRVPYQKLQSYWIKKGYLSNFFKGSCGIKILYGGAGREYGSGGRICHKQGVKDI